MLGRLAIFLAAPFTPEMRKIQPALFPEYLRHKPYHSVIGKLLRGERPGIKNIVRYLKRAANIYGWRWPIVVGTVIFILLLLSFID